MKTKINKSRTLWEISLMIKTKRTSLRAKMSSLTTKMFNLAESSLQIRKYSR